MVLVEDTANNVSETENNEANRSLFEGYKLITVDSCSLSGAREPNAVVDIGYGDREYWAFTNEYGQVVRVVADKITLQDDSSEGVTSEGRYCSDEAKVPGVESSDLDEGHIIADSLGGVSNAYNITPQNSTLNRHGVQAYMEKVIRDAGGCTDFEAIITYPDTNTQIPSHYSYSYTVAGNRVTDEFDNVSPEGSSSSSENTSSSAQSSGSSSNSSAGVVVDSGNSSSSNSSSSNEVADDSSLKGNQVVENAPTNGQMVYITATGSKYHSIPNCGKTNPNKVREVSVEEATSMGLEPCKKCY